MARPAALAAASFVGLLLAGCSGGGFGQSGVSVPRGGDGVQTVSDAADALDIHRASASENAKAAIGATDALGSFVRDISEAEHLFSGSARAPHNAGQRIILNVPEARVLRFSRLSNGDKRIVSGSDLVMQPSLGNVTDFCQSSAGYSLAGIPSLDATFGWQSGAFSGGARATDGRGYSTWSANAGGEIVEGAIGALSIQRNAAGSACPMTGPAFTLDGADVANPFSIPISMAFHRGALSSISVANGTFANGESLDVTSAANRQSIEVGGIIHNGRTKVATFRTNASGNGTLTITSTGAQYVISDWIVVSI
ncbi:MAG: hypothetical protein WB681_04820 [Candidatus Cybelea sp.]